MRKRIKKTEIFKVFLKMQKTDQKYEEWDQKYGESPQNKLSIVVV